MSGLGAGIAPLMKPIEKKHTEIIHEEESKHRRRTSDLQSHNKNVALAYLHKQKIKEAKALANIPLEETLVDSGSDLSSLGGGSRHSSDDDSDLADADHDDGTSNPFGGTTPRDNK